MIPTPYRHRSGFPGEGLSPFQFSHLNPSNPGFGDDMMAQFQGHKRRVVRTAAKMFFFWLVVSMVVGAVCWTYAINTWLAYNHQPPQVEWWMGALLGLVPWFGRLSLPAAIVTWIVTLFVPLAAVVS